MNKNKKKIFLLAIIALILSAIFVVYNCCLNMRSNNDKKKIDPDNIGEIYFQPTPVEHIAVSDDGITMYADNEVLVVAANKVKYSEIEDLAEEYDAEIVGYIEQTGDYQWKLSETNNSDGLQKLINDLSDNELVSFASVNYISEVETDSILYDIQAGEQWIVDQIKDNTTDSRYGRAWGAQAINAPLAWYAMDILKENIVPVKVGLIDNAFDENHEDLGFAKDGIFYDAGNNRETIDTAPGDEGHGTHVAGTMAAKGNNIEGICGIYPYGDGMLYAVSSLGEFNYTINGSFKTSSMYQKIAFSELILRNVKVINSSQNNRRDRVDQIVNKKAGWENAKQELDNNSKILGEYLDRLINLGYDFVIVSAAGNGSDSSTGNMEAKYNSFINNISEADYPQVYDRIIVVGSVGRDYNISEFSNAGTRTDIYAPGEKIFSTTPNNEYQNQYTDDNGKIYGWSGTSMASPHVAGVAADVWSMNSYLTGADVKQIVCEQYSDNSHKDSAGDVDYPLVDAHKAVRESYRRLSEGGKLKSKPQNGAALGWVYESDRETPIEDVTVIPYQNDSALDDHAATTDEYGHFELVIPSGDYELHFSKEGYNEKILDCTVKNGEVNYFNEGIDEVIVLERSDTDNSSSDSDESIDNTENDSSDFKPEGDKQVDDKQSEDNNSDTLNYNDLSRQATLNDYWVVFKEGYRNNQIEMSSFDVNGSFIVTWNRNLVCNNQKGKCNQYYYKNGKFEKVREYGILTDYATEIIASNFDIYDKNGNIVFKSTSDYNNTDGNPVYLEDMPIIESDQYADNQGDSFVYKIGEHRYTRGNTDIDGVSYTHGIEVWIARWDFIDESSWAYSVFDLDGKYSTLSGKGVLIKSHNTTNFDTTLEFIGDGELIKSYHLTPDSIPFDINVNVSGVKHLKVYAYDNKAVSSGTSFGLTGMTLISDSKKGEYIEEELKAAVEKTSGEEIGEWLYDDYDDNGTKEAYAIINGDYDDFGDDFQIKSIYFVDSLGNVQLSRDFVSADRRCYYINNNGLTSYKGKKFLAISLHAHGSGGTTYLFSVKDNMMQELNVSGSLQSFFVEEGKAYTTVSDFSNGYHEYPKVELYYNEENEEFYIPD